VIVVQACLCNFDDFSVSDVIAMTSHLFAS
jgi:hypothetical protein